MSMSSLAARRPTALPRRFAAVAAVVLALIAPMAEAQRAPAAAMLRERLHTGWVTENGTRIIGLELNLAEGWKTYWRIPGEAGIAPRLEFSGSQNLANARVLWPRPTVFDQSGFRSIGYLGRVLLPIELTPRDPSRPIALDAELSIGLCNEICVPVDLQLEAAFRGPGEPDPALRRAMQDESQPASRAGLVAARCSARPGRNGLELELRLTIPRLGPEEHVVLEMPGSTIWVSDSETRREGGELIARARLRVPGGAPVSFERGSLGITILAGERMLTHQGCAG